MAQDLVVECDRRYAIPKERLQLKVSLPGAQRPEGKKRKTGKSWPLVVTLEKCKFECEPRSVALPATGFVEFVGKLDFNADDVDASAEINRTVCVAVPS